MRVSVVLPCYNPPENWASNIIQEYRSISALIKDEVEFILVEDGTNSRLDAGIVLLKATLPEFVCVQYAINRGKGFAIRKGMENAGGEILIYTDIDFPYTTESFYKIYSALKNKECDLAVGVKNDTYYTNAPLSRRILSKGLRRMIRFFLSIPITDTQCGLKGFTREMKPLFLKTSIDRYLFDLEFIRMAHGLKHAIKPIQIELNKNVQFRNMNYRILFPEIINFIKLVFRSK